MSAQCRAARSAVQWARHFPRSPQYYVSHLCHQIKASSFVSIGMCHFPGRNWKTRNSPIRSRPPRCSVIGDASRPVVDPAHELLPSHSRPPDPPDVWLPDYLQTYLERDVRSLSNIGDLETFERFLALCAGRSAQLLNYSGLASDCGVSVDTARRWISVLKTSFIVFLLTPHHRNFNKRVVKSPKLYFHDTGLLCQLLGIRDATQIVSHPLRGAIFENHVVAEVAKSYLHHRRTPPLYLLARQDWTRNRSPNRGIRASLPRRDKIQPHPVSRHARRSSLVDETRRASSGRCNPRIRR